MLLTHAAHVPAVVPNDTQAAVTVMQGCCRAVGTLVGCYHILHEGMHGWCIGAMQGRPRAGSYLPSIKPHSVFLRAWVLVLVGHFPWPPA